MSQPATNSLAEIVTGDILAKRIKNLEQDFQFGTANAE